MNKLVIKNILIILYFFVQIDMLPGQIYADDFQQDKSKSLREVLSALSINDSLNFIYNDVLLDNREVNFNFDVQNADSVIKILLAKYNLAYKKINANTYVLYKAPVIKQSRINAGKYETRIEVKKTPVLEPPKIIKSSRIPYPELAKEKGIEGTVEIQMLINKKGNVEKARINQSSRFDILDRAAMEYTQKIKFQPARIDSQTVAIWTRWKIIFELVPSDTTYPEVVFRKIDQ